MRSHLALAAFISALALAACGGGGGGGTGGGGVIPGPTPTPKPTATPTIGPQNYLPVDGKIAYATGTAASNASTSLGFVGTPLTDTTCAAIVNPVFGEYLVSAATALVDYGTINAYQASHNGANPLLVISKDPSGNVYVVGLATYGQTKVPAVTCVAPYLWVRAQMKAGDTWEYTNGVGITLTATVKSVEPSQTVTIQCGSCSQNGQTATYSNVATVQYGTANPYTMLWAAGIGPVQTINSVPLTSAPLGVGLTWTASSIVQARNSP